MKTIIKYCIAFFSLFLFAACNGSVNDMTLQEDSQNQISISPQEDGDKKGRARGRRGIPFKARFHTIRTYLNGDLQDCNLDIYEVVTCSEDPFLAFNLQCGGGNGTHLGKFSTVMSFCGDNATFAYNNGTGVFIAANGDELNFRIEEGQVYPYEHPLYEFQFQDAFVFDGGTGRFEGATGGGYTNSFVDLFDDADPPNFIPNHQTDHVWTGTLSLH
jgi:hypothetical protein